MELMLFCKAKKLLFLFTTEMVRAFIPRDRYILVACLADIRRALSRSLNLKQLNISRRRTMTIFAFFSLYFFVHCNKERNFRRTLLLASKRLKALFTKFLS